MAINAITLHTVEQVAELFHIKKDTVYQWRFYGKLKGTKVNGRLLFKQHDILALIGE